MLPEPAESPNKEAIVATWVEGPINVAVGSCTVAVGACGLELAATVNAMLTCCAWEKVKLTTNCPAALVAVKSTPDPAPTKGPDRAVKAALASGVP